MGWLVWTIVIVVGVIILIRIIRKMRNREDGDIWSQVKRIKRGACKKFKDLLFGC